MLDLIELQHELMEAQGKDPSRKFKARIAKVQQRRLISIHHKYHKISRE